MGQTAEIVSGTIDMQPIVAEDQNSRSLATGAKRLVAGAALFVGSFGAAGGVAGAMESSPTHQGAVAGETCTTKDGVTSCQEIVSDSVSSVHRSESDTVSVEASSSQGFILDTHWITKAEQKAAAKEKDCEVFSGSEVEDGGWYDGNTHVMGYEQEPAKAEVGACAVPVSEIPAQYRSILGPAIIKEGKYKGDVWMKNSEKDGLDAENGIANTDCGNPLIVKPMVPPKNEVHPNARIVWSASTEDLYKAIGYVHLTATVDATAKATAKTPNGTCSALAEATESGTDTITVYASAISDIKETAVEDAIAAAGSLSTKEQDSVVDEAKIKANLSASGAADAKASCSSSSSSGTPPAKETEATCNYLPAISLENDEVTVDKPNYTLNSAKLDGIDINFGNGNTDEYQPGNFPVNYTYSQPGEYDISATILTSLGNETSAACGASVDIVPPPSPTPPPPPSPTPPPPPSPTPPPPPPPSPKPVTITEVGLTTAEALYPNGTEQLCVGVSASDGSLPSVAWAVASGEGQVTASYQDQDGDPNHECTTFSDNPDVGLSDIDATATDGSATPVTVQFQIATQQDSSGF